MRLRENAADQGYSNDDIQTALYEAYSTVCDIIVGDRKHPLDDLYIKHIAQKIASASRQHPKRKITYDNLPDSDKLLDFSVPILPGDASLIDPFINDLACDFAKRFGALHDSTRITVLSLILFKLVVLRTYLGRPPENDLNIFELARDGKFSRIWTTHEQALATCAGEEDTSRHAKFPIGVIHACVRKAQGVNNSEIAFAHKTSLVSLDIPESFAWSEHPGLVGGDRKPRNYRPPHLQHFPAAGPRPKPRPVKRNNKADTGSTPSQPMSQIQLEQLNPVHNRAGQNLSQSKKKGLESNSEPAVLRRGSRARKAVIR